jgi:hypothetical protein
MSVRRPWLLLVVLLIPAVAHAGHHKFDVFVALSGLTASGSDVELGGWHFSGAAVVEKHRWLSFAGDISVHFLGRDKTDRSVDPTQVTFMAGPRATVKDDHELEGLFAHLMVFGAVHRTGVSQVGSTTAGAFAVGAGIDRPVGDDKTWAFRLQADYIRPCRNRDLDGWGGVRLSVGATYRFRFPHEPEQADKAR